jgi:TRAP-type C4-dicarboxylate transport system permease small subunit
MRNKIERFINIVTSGLALLGAIGVVAMLVHVTAYVVLRYALQAPVPATVEIVSYYYMVLIAFLPIAWAERRGDMISVEIFEKFFVGRLGRIVEIIVALITTAVYVVMTYTTWLAAMREFSAKSFTISLSIAIPTWPGYFILPLSFALAAFVTLYRGLMPPVEEPAQ